MPTTMRLLLGPQVTRSPSDGKEYSPGGKGPRDRAARQLGSGSFLHTSRPEMAHAIVFPLVFGSSETMNIRPVVIVYPRRKLLRVSGTSYTTSSNGLQISPPVS